MERNLMTNKPTYEELEQRVRELEQSESEHAHLKEAFKECEEQRKQAGETAKQIEKRYVTTLGSIEEGYFETNLSGEFTFVSDWLATSLERSREELIGMSNRDYMPPDSGRKVYKAFFRLYDHGESIKKLDYEVILGNGTHRFHELSATLMKDQSGQPIGFCGISRDITERKQTEGALRESEKRFRLAFQTSPIPININRVEDGLYIDINEGFTKVLGYSREEIIGNPSLPVEIWKNPEDREGFVDALTKTGFVENMEAQFVGKGGKIKNGLISARVTRISGENVIISVTRDITDRKKAEEALRESEKKYRMIAENTNDLIQVLDLDMMRHTMRLTYVSPSVKKITGYTVEERLHTPMEKILTPQSLKMIMEVLSKGLKRYAKSPGQDISDRTEWQEYHKDGHLIWIEAETNFLRDDHGKLIGLVGVSRDISERKKAEKEKAELEARLRQSQKMESLGTLAGGIAHEFNNFLAVIVGNTELALDDVTKSNSPEESLKEILSASLRAKDVVSRILGFAQKSVFQLMPVEIGPIIDETLKLIQPSIPKTIELRRDLLCKSDLVMADSTQIQQLLINLCANARKAMEKQGGVLAIKLENTVLDEKTARFYENLSPGNYLKLTVRDTGHGIDLKIMDRLFDPFFTTASLADASGMGLAVVYGIVKSHNGAIRVTSESCKGSVFEVLFPLPGDKEKTGEGAFLSR